MIIILSSGFRTWFANCRSEMLRTWEGVWKSQFEKFITIGNYSIMLQLDNNLNLCSTPNADPFVLCTSPAFQTPLLEDNLLMFLLVSPCLGSLSRAGPIPAILRPPPAMMQPPLDLKPFLSFPVEAQPAVGLFPGFNTVRPWLLLSQEVQARVGLFV